MFRTIKARLAVPALVAAAAAVLTFGFASPPADAAIGSMNARLAIGTAGNGYASVQVTGTVKMTRAEAQNLINQNARVYWRLYGSDTFSDDYLYGPDPAGLLATDRGLEYKGLAVMRNSVLNEDWGTDEVYSSVSLSKNGTIRAADSNIISRSF